MNPELDEITWVAERRRDVPDPDGASTDRARIALMGHMSAEITPRRRRLPWLAAATATATVAAGAVILLTDGSGGGTITRDAVSTGAGAGLQESGHPSFVLERLAQSVAQSPALPGNATLVYRSTDNTDPGSAPSTYSGYDLYEDNGDYYFGQTMADLQNAAANPSTSDTRDAGLGNVVAEAATVAGLSPQQAAEKLLAADPHPTPHAGQNLDTPGGGTSRWTHADVQRDLDGILWQAITAALEGGAGQPQVRAGALQAASAMPNIAVTTTTDDDQAVYQIDYHDGPDGYTESATVDAQTGVLLNESDGGATSGSMAGPQTNTTFKVSRVTAPDLTPAG
jgi:hypothetical protein